MATSPSLWHSRTDRNPCPVHPTAQVQNCFCNGLFSTWKSCLFCWIWSIFRRLIVKGWISSWEINPGEEIQSRRLWPNQWINPLTKYNWMYSLAGDKSWNMGPDWVIWNKFLGPTSSSRFPPGHLSAFWLRRCIPLCQPALYRYVLPGQDPQQWAGQAWLKPWTFPSLKPLSVVFRHSNEEGTNGAPSSKFLRIVFPPATGPAAGS